MFSGLTARSVFAEMVDIIIDAEPKSPLNTFLYAHKITYEDDYGTEQDITNYVMAWRSKRVSLLYGIGSFSILLDNYEGRFNTILTHARKINIYSEHVSNHPPNKIFN